MQISFDKRTVTLSIGEFAEFTDAPVAAGGSGRGGGGIWRAQVGQVWHSQLRRNLEEQEPTAAFEVSIRTTLPHRNWLFEIQGRADQILLRDGGVLIREIKTTERALPANEPELQEIFPSYFLQLRAYQRLLPLVEIYRDLPVTAELVFVEIQTGMTQTVELEPDRGAAFERQIERIYGFVERRRDHLERLQEFSFHPPFASPRPGQEGIGEKMEEMFAAAPVGLFEAPTGFGKTGVAWEFALNQLRSGGATRLLYVTGKATGQIQAAAQLEEMLGNQRTVSFLQVRNKGEHCIHTQFHCFREVCPYLDDLEGRWRESGLARTFAESGTRVGVDFLREVGRNARICPYEITRSTLPLADIWIGDYNYVFSPSNRGLFYNQPGFDPSQTLLIVDEAHNLPARVADAFSSRVSLNDALQVMTELELFGARAGLLRAWERWLDFLTHLERCDELSPALEEELRDVVALICDQLGAHPLDYPALGPDVTEQLMEMFSIRQLLETEDLQRLLWSPERGQLRLSCLDAGPFIGRTLREFRQVLLMSATFGPLEAFRAACRLKDADTSALQADVPWRKAACDVAVDLRVDTRLRSRERHLSTTAATVAALVSRSPAPVVIFFSSYRYAGDVLRRLDEDWPVVRVALQERGLSFDEQVRFVEESLVLADTLFLILGSSYAESIDLLGGKVAHAMVVGPALPEVNALQKARMKNHEGLRHEEAFQAVYQVPGMQRVNQALGRLVRGPGQETKILLHCQRFADTSYSSLLHQDHQPKTFLTTSEELDDWLAGETAAV